MKIATYNVWNADTDFDNRLKLLIKELNKFDMDIIALQEVKNKDIYDYLLEQSQFEFGVFFDGLAFLSKRKAENISSISKDNNYMLRVEIDSIGYTNMHLDWKDSSTRLKGIYEYLDSLEVKGLDVEFVLGDFNESPEESVHFELVVSSFTDIHQMFAHNKNDIPEPTLDMEHNPRWRGIESEEEPSRFDWILVSSENEATISDVKLIGVDETEGVCPSDHYGVLVDLDI